MVRLRSGGRLDFPGLTGSSGELFPGMPDGGAIVPDGGYEFFPLYNTLDSWAVIDDKKVIYSMYRVSGKHGIKQVLKDISLSCFYGAKIGVIGLNGSGKSSLLRILAGVDTEFSGKTSVSPGYTIGWLER
jgi:hypothetical protein